MANVRACNMQCRALSSPPSLCECIAHACTHALLWMNNSRLNFICAASISTWRGIFIRSPSRYGDESFQRGAAALAIVMTISSFSSPPVPGGLNHAPRPAGWLADGRSLGARGEGSLFIIGGRQLPSITLHAEQTHAAKCVQRVLDVCMRLGAANFRALLSWGESTRQPSKKHTLFWGRFRPADSQ